MPRNLIIQFYGIHKQFFTDEAGMQLNSESCSECFGTRFWTASKIKTTEKTLENFQCFQNIGRSPMFSLSFSKSKRQRKHWKISNVFKTLENLQSFSVVFKIKTTEKTLENFQCFRYFLDFGDFPLLFSVVFRESENPALNVSQLF